MKGRVVRVGGMCRGGRLVAAVLVVAAGCGSPSAAGGPAAAAEQTYVACAEELGVHVVEVELSPDDISVQLDEHTTAEAEEEVRVRCEPMAMAMFDEEPAAPALPVVPDGVDGVGDYLRHLEAEGFAGAMVVDRDGHVETTAAFGQANRSRNRANTVDTVFDIGSIAKTFTAAAVLRLVDEDRLALDDTVGDLLAAVPEDKRNITVRQLLDFTSGLGEYHDTEGDFQPMTRAAAQRRILDPPLRFAPGTDTAYSNSSYTLAAIIIEEITGRPFIEVVRGLLVDADLDHTAFYGSPALRALPVATGYRDQRHGANNPAAWRSPSWALLGAGGMASSVRDLRRWWKALHEPGVLSSEMLAVAHDELLPTARADGLEFRAVGGTNDFGFDAAIVHVPAAGILVVVVSNGNPPGRTVAADAAWVVTRLLAE